jgi:hypothetical protein
MNLGALLAIESAKNKSQFKKLIVKYTRDEIINAIKEAEKLLRVINDPIAIEKLHSYFQKNLPENQSKVQIKTKNMATRKSKQEAIEHLELGYDNRSNPIPTLINLKSEFELVIQKINNIIDKFGEDPEKIKRVGSAQIGRIINALKKRLCSIDNLMTRHDYLSRARTKIRKNYATNEYYSLIFERTKSLHDPIATRYKTEYQKMNRANRNSPSYRVKGQAIQISIADKLIRIAENLIVQHIEKTKSWGRLTNALSLVSGRRIYEICVTGKFTVVDSHRVMMSGVAKQKNEEDFIAKSIEFPTLINANIFVQGVNALRNKKDFTGFNDYKEFCDRCRTAISKVLKKDQNCPVLFDIPEIKTQLTPKMMRQIYAAIALYKIKKQYPNESEVYHSQELAKILGHGVRKYGDNVVSDDVHTIMSYKDWNIID